MIKIRTIIFSIILVCLIGCSFHKYDIPIIGWRLEVAAQRRHHKETLEREVIRKRELAEEIRKQYSVKERDNIG